MKVLCGCYIIPDLITWTEPIVVSPSDPNYDHNHKFPDDKPAQPEPSTPVEEPKEETPAEPSRPAEVAPQWAVPGDAPVRPALEELTWTEPIIVDPSDPRYDDDHHFDDEPTTPAEPSPSTPATPSAPVDEDDDDSDEDEDENEQPTPSRPSGNEEWFVLDGIIDNAVDRVVDSGIKSLSESGNIQYNGGLYAFQGDIEEMKLIKSIPMIIHHL